MRFYFILILLEMVIIMKKTVLITGASRGIGEAIALSCAKKQYRLLLTCKQSVDELENVKEMCCELGSRCETFVGDIGVASDVKALFEYAAEIYGGIDILINNAGVSYIGLLTDMSNEEWNQIIQTNLSSVFYCCKEAIPYMVSKKEGRIMNISSMWGNVGASCEVAYSATKGGVNTFTKALAKELAPSNIQVNALALGMIDTKMNDEFSQEEKASFVEDIPVGRMGTAKEIGELVVNLLGGSRYMTGQVITVDGGYI